MNIRKMKVSDIDSVLWLYIDYYNRVENGCWTEEKAKKRLHQVLTIEDSYSLILFEEDIVIGFAMGYFKQYDDILGYTLEEIVIKSDKQNRGYGSSLLSELESRVREKGASLIELQAVNDEMHSHFYGRFGCADAENFVLKVKWLD